MKTLYGLSWRAFHRCHCTGPTRGLHPIPVHGPAHHAAAVRARIDGVSLPRDPVRGAAGRDGLPVRAAVGAAAAGGGRGACWRWRSRTTSFTRRSPASTRRSPPWRSRSASPTGSRCAARAGASPAASLFGIALGVKHNAWLMPFFLAAHYLWMRRGDSAPPPPAAHPAGVRVDGGAGAAHLLRALAVAVARADGAHARVLQPPPAARALQLRVPGPELEQPADDHRATS